MLALHIHVYTGYKPISILSWEIRRVIQRGEKLINIAQHFTLLTQ